eukprot:Phypoly_transcript_15611.p1 GENE.Phypoly_transcript_15611~~Phypoly_transcript_15611.p1  ORF type:complete len:252 (+),score=42.34 Phypoly_transcript_15611:49-756(+)
MTPPYRHLFVFICFFVFMYLNLDTFEAAKMDADQREAADPNVQRKIIHLIRHGQAQHNVDNKYDILDPTLTALGNQQAKDLGKRFESIDVQLVVVSPLRRTVETALNVFASDKFKEVPVVANEYCRESYGVVICDKRRNLAEIKADFASRVDFSLIETEEDTWWEPTKEPEEHLILRATEFYNFLRVQSYTKIAVVAHHQFLRALSGLLRQKPHSNAHAYTSDDFENCEARIVFV